MKMNKEQRRPVIRELVKMINNNTIRELFKIYHSIVDCMVLKDSKALENYRPKMIDLAKDRVNKLSACAKSDIYIRVVGEGCIKHIIERKPGLHSKYTGYVIALAKRDISYKIEESSWMNRWADRGVKYSEYNGFRAFSNHCVFGSTPVFIDNYDGTEKELDTKNRIKLEKDFMEYFNSIKCDELKRECGGDTGISCLIMEEEE